jgi:DnaK suppressor protein
MAVRKKVVKKQKVAKTPKHVAKKTPKKKIVKVAKKPAKKVVKKKVASKAKVAKKPVKKAAPKVKIAKKPIAKANPVVKKAAAPRPIFTAAIKLGASLPKDKKVAKSQMTIKSNLADLIPEYEHTEEKIDQDYMNAGKKAHFRQLLNNWKGQLMQEVDRTVVHMKDEAANFPDPSDRATQEEGFSLELRTRDRERKLIKKIDEALQRVTEDEYGYCEACGVEIGYSRLEARPTATLCIDCKTVDEIRERQIAS